jgi:hypothetical protein
VPIHIHLPNNTTTSLFTLTDDLYTALTSPFTTLEKKTGIFIDPYGNARLTHQHAALLLKIINAKFSVLFKDWDKRFNYPDFVYDFSDVARSFQN